MEINIPLRGSQVVPSPTTLKALKAKAKEENLALNYDAFYRYGGIKRGVHPTAIVYTGEDAKGHRDHLRLFKPWYWGGISNLLIIAGAFLGMRQAPFIKPAPPYLPDEEERRADLTQYLLAKGALDIEKGTIKPGVELPIEKDLHYYSAWDEPDIPGRFKDQDASNSFRTKGYLIQAPIVPSYVEQLGLQDYYESWFGPERFTRSEAPPLKKWFPKSLLRTADAETIKARTFDIAEAYGYTTQKASDRLPSIEKRLSSGLRDSEGQPLKPGAFSEHYFPDGQTYRIETENYFPKGYKKHNDPRAFGTGPAYEVDGVLTTAQGESKGFQDVWLFEPASSTIMGLTRMTFPMGQQVDYSRSDRYLASLEKTLESSQ